jgi:hypothetical protein
MDMPLKITRIIPMSHVGTQDRWIVVPKPPPGNRHAVLRSLKYKKGNCFFDSAVPKGMIDFIFRAVVHLGLQKHPVTVVRGTVKKHGRTVRHAVSLKELPWGTGTLIVVPRKLRYRDTIRLQITGREYEIRIMENIVLQALLRLARPEMQKDWYPQSAAVILSSGWKHLGDKMPSDIVRIRKDPDNAL